MADADWWRLWEPEPGGEPLPEATIDAMREQPRFHDALAQALGRVLELVDGDPEFHRITVDIESLILGVLVLYLDATGGLTHRRLRQVAGISGLLSGGRISALLLRMQAIGFVRSEGDHAPGTAKIYRPTPRMRAAFNDWLRAMLDAIRVMAPQAEDVLGRLDPEGERALWALLGQRTLERLEHPRTGPAAERMEPMTAISGRRFGNLALFILLDAAATRAGRFPATGPVEVSISVLAKRCRTSRTQVRRILRIAEAGGLLAPGDGEGVGDVQPLLVESVERLYAEIFISVAVAVSRSRRAVSVLG